MQSARWVPLVSSSSTTRRLSDFVFPAWCATSTDSNLNYLTYAYCGYGNNEGGQCSYPFTYSGEEYYSCAAQDTSTPW